VQLAMVLYNDRVFAHERCADIELIIDKDPTYENIFELVTQDERNRLAHLELRHYEKHGDFMYEHPVLIVHRKRNELDKLRRIDPSRFLDEISKSKQYIKRYESQIRKGKYKDDAELEKWQCYIRDYQLKLKLMTELISD
jgi:hypothetical protein